MNVAKARALRRTITPPEAMLWQTLRARPGGFKLRRQHPIGPYILDFLCRSAMVAVEADGIAHEMGHNPARDGRRDRWLAEQGIVTLRFVAAQALQDVEPIIVQIVETCSARTAR